MSLAQLKQLYTVFSIPTYLLLFLHGEVGLKLKLKKYKENKTQ